MRRIYIKIIFDTNPDIKSQDNVLLFQNYEEIITSNLMCGKRHLYTVYIKNIMPRNDIDNIIYEFCQRIEFKDHYHVSLNDIDKNYVFSEELNCLMMVSRAEYTFAIDCIK